MSVIKVNTFEEAFKESIKACINNHQYKIESRTGEMLEIIGLTYQVTDTESYQFENEKVGRIDYVYADSMFKWIMSGSTDVEELAKQYPNTARFLEKPKSSELPHNFNTFYGPRIMRQFNQIINELKANPNTRRAVISVLDKDDVELLDKDETLEFPCTDSLTLNIRGGKLHSHLHMRSQNMGQVAKLDMYLWGRLACYIAGLLGVKTGTFQSTIVSAHVFTKDLPYLETIL